MLINPISSNQKQTNFRGKQNPEILKNQLKILLTQDIWAPKLSVKLPETDLEKEVLLEILENRAKLEKFTRLKNQKFEILSNKNLYEHLKQTDKDDQALTELSSKLKSYGNIKTTLNTLDKNIEIEIKKNKPALDYFKEIDNLEEEYLNKHLTKYTKIDKFWHQIRKNNINKNLQYSTKELIDIIKQKNPSDITTTTVINTHKPLTKKIFIAKIEKQYEQILRQNINIYSGKELKSEDAVKAKTAIYTDNADGFNHFPEVQKSLAKIFEGIRNKYMFKVNRIVGIEIFPIGEILKDMHIVEKDLKESLSEIKILKQELKNAPDDMNLKNALNEAEQVFEVHKKDWLMRLEYSMKYEQINREKFREAGRESEYNYLTDENIILNKYKKAYKIFEKNQTLTNDELLAAIN